MRTYPRDKLAILLGVTPDDFRDAITKVTPATQQSPCIYHLKTPVNVGERKPAKYVAEMHGRGFALFPSMQSARLWAREAERWEAVEGR
jgi:hypothetical protein